MYKYLKKANTIKLNNLDICNLIDHATSSKSNRNPKGMIKFYQLLSELKVPKNIIKNRAGKRIMKSEKSKLLKWRPPGEIE